MTNPPRAFASKTPFSGRSLLAASLFAIASSGAWASSLYWDANEGSPGLGGAGTWQNGGATLWNTGSTGLGTLQAWNNASNDIAIFSGTGGTITVSGGVTADKLTFTAGGYSLTGSTITQTGVTNASKTLIEYTGGTGDITVANAIDLTLTGATSSNTYYYINNATGSRLELTGNINVTAGNGTGTKAISFSQAAGGTLIFRGSIVSVGSASTSVIFGQDAISADSATYIMSGSSNLVAGTRAQIVKGTVLLENGQAFSSGQVRVGSDLNGGGAAGESARLLTSGSMTVANSVSLDRGNALLNRVVGGNTADVSVFSGAMDFANSTNNLTLQVTAVAGGRVDFSGEIKDGTGSGAVEKIGAGIVRFTRATGNTYDGGTKVSAGTLLLANTSNSATGTGVIQVAGGATLGGTGFATGHVTATGATGNTHFAPGDTGGIGTLTLSGGLTANNGATFDFQLDGASIDKVNFGSGALSLDKTITFNLTTLGTVLTGTPYSLFAGTGTWTGGVDLAFVFNTPVGYGLDTSYGGGNGYIWDSTGKSLTVQLIAVPEPGTCLFLGLGLGFFLVRRKRRQA